MATATVNAVIKKASLVQDSHGFLLMWLFLECEDRERAFGGAVLHGGAPTGHNTAGRYISAVLHVAGVDDFGQLEGRPLRARVDRHEVEAVGHIVRDAWFCPATDLR